MVVLGLLLLLAAGVLTVEVVVANTDAAAVSAFGQSASGLTTGRLFLAGAVTGAIAILGLTMMLAGLSRRRARRAVRRRELRDAHDERETLAEENARLRDELAASRSNTSHSTTSHSTASYADNAVYPDDAVGRTEADSTARHGLSNR